MKDITFKGIPLFPDLRSVTDEDPPTPKQMDLLDKWGMAVPETKGEASLIIRDELEFRRNLGWREEGDDPDDDLRSTDDADGWEG